MILVIQQHSEPTTSKAEVPEFALCDDLRCSSKRAIEKPICPQ